MTKIFTSHFTCIIKTITSSKTNILTTSKKCKCELHTQLIKTNYNWLRQLPKKEKISEKNSGVRSVSPDYTKFLKQITNYFSSRDILILTSTFQW